MTTPSLARLAVALRQLQPAVNEFVALPDADRESFRPGYHFCFEAGAPSRAVEGQIPVCSPSTVDAGDLAGSPRAFMKS